MVLAGPSRSLQPVPARVMASCTAPWRDRLSIMNRACSDTGTLPKPGLFTTVTPRAVAASMSMASVPRPDEHTTSRSSAAAITSASTLLG